MTVCKTAVIVLRVDNVVLSLIKGIQYQYCFLTILSISPLRKSRWCHKHRIWVIHTISIHVTERNFMAAVSTRLLVEPPLFKYAMNSKKCVNWQDEDQSLNLKRPDETECRTAFKSLRNVWSELSDHGYQKSVGKAWDPKIVWKLWSHMRYKGVWCNETTFIMTICTVVGWIFVSDAELRKASF